MGNKSNRQSSQQRTTSSQQSRQQQRTSSSRQVQRQPNQFQFTQDDVQLLQALMMQRMVQEDQLYQMLFQDMIRPQNSPPVNDSAPIRVPFNVKKDTVAIKPNPSDPEKYSLVFDTDSTVECFVIIHQVVIDVLDQTGNSLYFYTDTQQYPAPMSFALSPGTGLQFPENLAVIDTHRIPEMMLDKSQEQVYPFVIEIRDKDANPEVASQTTFIYFTKENGIYEAKVDIQKLKIRGQSYEQAEVFGLDEDQSFTRPEELDSEWVICLTNSKDTMVMPCRHICMCSSWCNEFRSQPNQSCPVCRKPVTNFIKLNTQEQEASSLA